MSVATAVPVERLRVGDRFEHWACPRGENEARVFVVDLLRDPEPHHDRFGQELLKLWCRTNDPAAGGTREGYVIYGPLALVDLIEHAPDSERD